MRWLLCQIAKILVLIISIMLGIEFIINSQPDLKIQCIIMWSIGFIDKTLLYALDELGSDIEDGNE